MVRIHLFQIGRAAVKYLFSTLQKKDGNLFAVADGNHSSNSPFGLACLFDVVT